MCGYFQVFLYPRGHKSPPMYGFFKCPKWYARTHNPRCALAVDLGLAFSERIQPVMKSSSMAYKIIAGPPPMCYSCRTLNLNSFTLFNPKVQGRSCYLSKNLWSEINGPLYMEKVCLWAHCPLEAMSTPLIVEWVLCTQTVGMPGPGCAQSIVQRPIKCLLLLTDCQHLGYSLLYRQ